MSKKNKEKLNKILLMKEPKNSFVDDVDKKEEINTTKKNERPSNK